MNKLYYNQVELLLRVLPLLAEYSDFALKGGEGVDKLPAVRLNKTKKTQSPESCLEILNLFDRDIMPSFEVF